YKTLIYFSLLFAIILITFPIAASMELDTNLLDQQVWEKLWFYLGSKTHLSTDLQMIVSLVASLFYSEISEHVGHGVLLNFFTGKYHQPKQEKRIFMFLDMKSSTTIAERLGHIRYIDLLRWYYRDLSDPIINCEGEVYQYVGDEVVVSWKYDKGIVDNNCLKCFFAMKEALQRQAEKYRQRFGLAPTFKAGIHCGEVTTGEVGALKKEIVFTGDVLNATARIQSLCNQFEVDLLVSADLIQLLDMNEVNAFRSIGNIELRGKVETLELYTIDGMMKDVGYVAD
ncbi:MAG: adenylate/guanylate cyclase domain-containing protein, partial [Cyclobacteriaceae bacterium]